MLVEFGCSNRHFATDQYFYLTSSAAIMSENDADDDCEWQCLKLLHRVAWEKAMDFSMFMNYAYGHEDKHVLDLVRKRQHDVDDAYYIDTGLALSSSLCESLGVRKEYYDPFKFIWSDHNTNRFLKGAVAAAADVDNNITELPSAPSSRKEVNEELAALTEVGHAWGYAWHLH